VADAGATTNLAARRSLRPRRSRILRLASTLAVVIFAVTAVVALATDNLHPTAKGEALTASPTTGRPSVRSSPAASGAASYPDTSTGTAPAPPLGGVGSSPGVGSTPASPPGAATIGPSGTAPGPTGNTSVPENPSTPTTATPGSVALASGVLKISAFGSNIGLPLLCNVAIGSLGPVLTNAAVSQLAAAITSSCITSGQQGSAALMQLNTHLGALAVADPALDPAISALANAFDGAGSQSGVPFASSLIAMGNIITFFVG
jgi:hypothetical protein